MMTSRLDGDLGKESFFSAAKNGQIFILEEIIRNGNESILSSLDWEGRSLLHHAVSNRQKEMVSFLLNHKCPIDIQDRDGRNIIHCAILNSDIEMIFQINNTLNSLSLESSPSSSSLSFQLLEGSNSKSDDMFRLSPQMIPLLIARDSNEGFTPLHCACKKRDARSAIILCKMISSHCKAGIFNLLSFNSTSLDQLLNPVDYYQRTPLSVAIESRGSSFLVTYLIQNGCRLPKQNELPLSPLQSSIIPHNQVLFGDLTSSSFGSSVQFGSIPLSEMKKFFNDEKSGDINFIIEEKNIYAHSDILISRCEYLAEKLKKEEAPNSSEHLGKIRIRLNNINCKTFYSILEWIYTNEVHTRNTSDLLDIWRASYRFKMKDLHRTIQMRLVDVLIENEKCVEKNSYLNEIKALFERAQVQKARYLNRFCSSYLLQHIDLFLLDEKCFPNLSNNVGKSQKSSFLTKQQYVEWLFNAVDDKYNPNEDLEMNQEKFVQFYNICETDFEESRENDSIYSNVSSLNINLSDFGTAGYHLLENAMDAPMKLVSATFNTVSSYYNKSFRSSSSLGTTVEQEDGEIIATDFDVLRTNWYWSRQRRKLRVIGNVVQRIDPDSQEIRSSTLISDISSIRLEPEDYLILNYSDLSSDYYQTKDSQKIIDILTKSNPLIEVVSDKK